MQTSAGDRIHLQEQVTVAQPQLVMVAQGQANSICTASCASFKQLRKPSTTPPNGGEQVGGQAKLTLHAAHQKSDRAISWLNGFPKQKHVTTMRIHPLP